jgi:hypothetical protein
VGKGDRDKVKLILLLLSLCSHLDFFLSIEVVEIQLDPRVPSR